MLVGVAGQPLLLEVFDSPTTLQELWREVLLAAAVDAVDVAPVPLPGRRARRFLDRPTSMPVMVGPGLGPSSSSDYVRRLTLAWHGRLVHTVATNPRHELVAA